MDKTDQLWGGRFTGKPDETFAEFNKSFSFDKRLFAADVRASIAHANGLLRAGVLTVEENAAITGALRTMLEFAAGDLDYSRQQRNRYGIRHKKPPAGERRGCVRGNSGTTRARAHRSDRPAYSVSSSAVKCELARHHHQHGQRPGQQRHGLRPARRHRG